MLHGNKNLKIQNIIQSQSTSSRNQKVFKEMDRAKEAAAYLPSSELTEVRILGPLGKRWKQMKK